MIFLYWIYETNQSINYHNIPETSQKNNSPQIFRKIPTPSGPWTRTRWRPRGAAVPGPECRLGGKCLALCELSIAIHHFRTNQAYWGSKMINHARWLALKVNRFVVRCGSMSVHWCLMLDPFPHIVFMVKITISFLVKPLESETVDGFSSA